MSEKKLVIKLKFGSTVDRDRESRPIRKQPQYEWNYKRIAVAFSLCLLVFVILAYGFIDEAPDKATVGRTADPEPVAASNESFKQNPSRSPTADHQVRSMPFDEINRIDEPRAPSGHRIEPSAGEKAIPKKVSSANEAPSVESDTQTRRVDPSQDDEQASGDSRNVVRAQFAWGIKDKEPTGEIRSPAILQPGHSVDLYFFSEFKGLQGQAISHVWLRNGKLVEIRDFEVGGDRWRVFSSKRLNSKLLGEWSVKIRNAEGKSLGTFALEVLQPARP